MTSILWRSDSNDWRIGTGTPPITSEQIDGHYQSLINAVNIGTYDKRGAIMLTHELNNFTMSQAMKWYPAMKQAFANIVPISARSGSSCVFGGGPITNYLIL